MILNIIYKDTNYLFNWKIRELDQHLTEILNLDTHKREYEDPDPHQNNPIRKLFIYMG